MQSGRGSKMLSPGEVIHMAVYKANSKACPWSELTDDEQEHFENIGRVVEDYYTKANNQGERQ